MHQTIFGETHKIEIVDRKDIQNFIDLVKEEYSKSSFNNCLYPNKKLIPGHSLNFLNSSDGNELNYELKFLIRSAYDECEKIYPYLGDLFLNLFFNEKELSIEKTFKYNKNYQSEFVENLETKFIKDIAEWFFDNCSLQRNVSIDSYDGDDIIIKKYDDINMNLEYDNIFLGDKASYEIKNYRYIIIDGLIDSIGEIHHLMHRAGTTKEPYVIFCFGMNDIVKKTILKNNSLGNTEIFPVIINFNEKSVNVLNDLAVIHDCDVVSALKGQTISQEIRKSLPMGNKIEFFKNKIILKPMCSDKIIMQHRSFINKRINEALHDVNIDLLSERMKIFTSKSLKIFIPSMLINEVKYTRDLDYFLRFLYNVSKKMTIINLEYRNNLFIPVDCIKILKQKINSLKKTYNNIEKAIIKVRR